MASVVADKEVVGRSIREAPPTHYVVKIQSFSLLANNAINKYISGIFEAGGYKWKLVLYPSGNKNYNVKDHLSLYLAMADTSSLRTGSEVNVAFRLFLLNQKKDTYLILQDARRFHPFKVECGFNEFIPLKEFNDASNGYLVEDTCVVGADVFVKAESTGCKGECLSLIKDASCVKHVWKMENFSKLRDMYCFSEEFIAGDQKWKIKICPKGDLCGAGSHISMYLASSDLESNSSGSKIYTSFKLRIIDQKMARHKVWEADQWFTTSCKDWGWCKSVSLSDLNQPCNGFLVNDVCIVEAEVTVLGITKDL